MGLSLVTPAVGNVIDDATAKLHVKLDSDEDNALLLLYRDAAEDNIAKYLHRALLASTWDYTLDGFPGSVFRSGLWRQAEIVPPLMPFTGVTSLKYLDADGVETTLAAEDYIVDTGAKPGRITPAAGETWPTTQVDRPNSVTLRFTAGYANPEAVPASIRAAILLRMGTLYAQREDVITGTIATPLPSVVTSLLSPYRFRWNS